MYQPPHFAETDLATLHGFIAAHPLGLLITEGPDGPVADPIPFVLDRDIGPNGTLRAHVARANPLWRAHDPARPVLVVFQGVGHYVSPGWYATKRETGKVVPTWNYALVQAGGSLIVHDDPVWIRDQIEALTGAHEGGRAEPWAVGDAPPAYIAGQIRGIVGLEIPIATLTGKLKLSQNRNTADHEGVVAGLAEEGTADAAAMADMMRKR